MSEKRVSVAPVWKKIPVIAAALAMSVLILGPSVSAQAATYTYANDARLASGAEIDSGTRPTISGGSVQVVLGISVTQYIKTYYPAPGYVEIGKNVTGAGQVGNLTHERVKNATSGCGWYDSGGGVASITCKMRT